MDTLPLLPKLEHYSGSEPNYRFSLAILNMGLNYLLQLRLFPSVFLMVVDGKLKGLVHILGASLAVGAGEGASLQVCTTGRPENSACSPALDRDCAAEKIVH
ncbi:uncharacterized protein N7483_008566 [Penicillium malachiteum]|uniref:uncharacterized protein n=1 Tax=Penicillium malachiteum TaxID=1324776 RepID=UPI002548800F|nr:uncharacterized protein N7483_008566 [Penicillium malachiteum]KAJ5720632.1 hypothetical protein N7483_008566 [Penicillium malachiteum]